MRPEGVKTLSLEPSAHIYIRFIRNGNMVDKLVVSKGFIATELCDPSTIHVGLKKIMES